nr:rhodanese-like domain-containing protein [Streptomyces canus]
MARITATEAHERTGAGAEALLLDVREREEWAAGHAPGAEHAPLSALTAGGRLPEAAEGRQVITICRSGKRSRQAAELLTARGVDAVDVLGGMGAWVGAGLAVEGGATSGAGPAAQGEPGADVRSSTADTSAHGSSGIEGASSATHPVAHGTPTTEAAVDTAPGLA